MFFLISILKSEFIEKEFSIIDGFIGGDVKSIFQDEIGRIWTATDFGVSIFDGHEFINFRYSEIYNISFAIEGDCSSDNNCWVLTDKGLFYYQNIGLINAVKINFFPKINLNHFAVSNNKVWISAKKGKELNYLKDGKFHCLAVPTLLTDIKEMYSDKFGQVWIFCANSIWKINDQSIVEVIDANLNLKFNGFNLHAVIPTENSFILSEKNSKINIELKLNGKLIPTNNNIQFDDGVYHPSAKFVYLLNQKINSTSDNFNKNGNIYTSIFIDNTGSIWLGQFNIVSLISNPETIMISPNQFIPEFNNIVAGFILKNDFIFAVNDKINEVFKINNNKISKSTIPFFSQNFTLNNEIEFLLSPNNKVYLVNKNTEKIKEIKKPKGSIDKIIQSQINERIIAKSDSGLFIYNNNKWDSFSKISTQNKLISAYKDNIFLIKNDSLVIINYTNSIEMYALPSHFIKEIEVFDNNLILIGDNKIFKFNLLNKYFEQDYIKPFFNFPIQSIKSNNNSLWLNCYNHLIRIESNQYELYQFNQNLITKNIYFGDSCFYSFNGHNLFRTNYFKTDVSSISPYIYSVSSQNGIIYEKDKIPFKESIKIKYFTPEYRNLGFYGYYSKLENNNSLFQFSKNNQSFYSGLDYKNYIFKVHPTFGNIFYTEAISELDFKISPPWYFSTQYKILYFVIILLLISLILFFIYNKYFKHSKINPFISKTYINVFNEFNAYKNSADGITNINSHTQKEMLFYLIINGYKFKSGVSHENFDTYFWPNIPTDQVLNRRYVVFSRIRKLIGEGTQKILLTKDGKCTLCWDDKDLYVDLEKYYNEIKKGLEQEKLTNNDQKIYHYQNALKIYGKGLCKDFSNIVFDKFYEALHTEAIKISTEVINFHIQREDDEVVIKYCNTQISWDNLDVLANEIKIKSMVKLGYGAQAKAYLNKFSIDYENEIGEKPNINMKNIKFN
jgi:hypothetical protein